jgi:hypothetical protein
VSKLERSMDEDGVLVGNIGVEVFSDRVDGLVGEVSDGCELV